MIVPALAILRGRGAEATAEAAVEIGRLAEAAGIGDLADFHFVLTRAGEHGTRLLQTQLEDSLGEAGAPLTAVFAKVDVRFGDDVEGIGGKAGMRVSW